MKIKRIAVILIALGMWIVSGCQVGINRNDDGSLRLEAHMPETALEQEIRSAIADPLIREVSVDLRSGYLLAEASRERLNGDGQDSLSFRLDLGARDGHMAAVISDVVFDGFSLRQDRVNLWNQRIATNLERAGSRSQDSQLVEVQVEPDAVTLVWRVETPRSRAE